MTDSIKLMNARAVVKSWKNNLHLNYWGPNAQGMLPSEVTQIRAAAYQSLAETIDDIIVDLLDAGFLTANITIIEFQKLASENANKAAVAREWAANLWEAEREVEDPV
jgi:hypothetical protein